MRIAVTFLDKKHIPEKYMSNYTCYRRNNYEQLIPKSFDSRYKDLESKSEYIGFTELDYKSENLIRESNSFRTALERKGAYFSDPQNRRVFISHKMEDKNIALRLAQRLSQQGYSFWLDVINPQLSPSNHTSSTQKAITIANIIELALLNCTDIVAIVTDNSHKSKWIAYEYARVKELKLLVENAAALTYNLNKPIPEYMYLGKIYSSESSFIQSLN
ncbi:MAG: toll/interleukin-1 receptor domain-containing protein [Bacteroidota bacterium]